MIVIDSILLQPEKTFSPKNTLLEFVIIIDFNLLQSLKQKLWILIEFPLIVSEFKFVEHEKQPSPITSCELASSINVWRFLFCEKELFLIKISFALILIDFNDWLFVHDSSSISIFPALR